MIYARHPSAEGAAPRRGLGLSLPMVILLAAIAAIRVPLHDLGIVQEGSAAAWLLVFVPLAVWVGVVLQRRGSRPPPPPTAPASGFAPQSPRASQGVFWGAVRGSPARP